MLNGQSGTATASTAAATSKLVDSTSTTPTKGVSSVNQSSSLSNSNNVNQSSSTTQANNSMESSATSASLSSTATQPKTQDDAMVSYMFQRPPNPGGQDPNSEFGQYGGKSSRWFGTDESALIDVSFFSHISIFVKLNLILNFTYIIE